MSEQIIVEISPTGATKIEANGFQGQACSLGTQQLEIAIGGQAANMNTDFKPEFTMPATTQQQNKTVF